MAESRYGGLLLIGDPHLEGRVPGFRKDEYPTVILDKLAWCLAYASDHKLLPAILGDLFDKPRDNPNWMLVRLMDMFTGELIGLYGNHDCADPALNENDSLSLLVKARRLRLVDEAAPWRGTMNGRPVVVGGSSYRQPIPASFETGQQATGPAPLVIWLTHHDIIVPGYEEQGRLKPREIEGIDVVVNGHIHRRLAEVRSGTTLWLTPGNISRRARSEATREHVPAVLRIDVSAEVFSHRFIEVPCRPYDEVFHSAIVEDVVQTGGSAFVAGLAELQARRTEDGVGLLGFLEKNVTQFDPAVAAEIMVLAQEVAENGKGKA